jgi:hypothetical protein
MTPESVTRIIVDADRVVDWGLRIGLQRSALELLEHIAGPTPDERSGDIDGNDFDFAVETWGWYVEWNSQGPGKRNIGLWFRDPAHAVYFKLLWGGQ